MNSAQIHLALTHVPVILSFVGLVMVIIALYRKNNLLLKTSYFILLFAGLAAIPVYLSGEGTEELVERLPGVSEAIIERHEEVAKLALISIVATGLMALIGLFLLTRKSATRFVKVVLLLLAFSSGGLMAQTAHLGGQIRHTEIRDRFTVENSTGNATDNAENTGNQNEMDD